MGRRKVRENRIKKGVVGMQEGVFGNDKASGTEQWTKGSSQGNGHEEGEAITTRVEGNICQGGI